MRGYEEHKKGLGEIMSFLTGPMRKHVDGQKELTAHSELKRLNAGEVVYIPLINMGSTTVEVLVKEGDSVKVGTKVAQKTTEKALLKGSKGLAKGIPYIGWAVTAGICIWDIIDYSKTSAEGKTLLKKNLAEYFREIKTELLCSTEHSIILNNAYVNTFLKFY